jgi:hypothetical protein
VSQPKIHNSVLLRDYQKNVFNQRLMAIIQTKWWWCVVAEKGFSLRKKFVGGGPGLEFS